MRFRPTILIAAAMLTCAQVWAEPVFPEAAGNYHGLSIPESDFAVHETAVINIQLRESGMLTGNFNKVGIRRTLRGRFDSGTRQFEQKIPIGYVRNLDGTKDKTFIIVRCELDPTMRTITGSLTEETDEGPLGGGLFRSNFVLSGVEANPQLADVLAGDRQSSFIDPPDTGGDQEIPGDGFTLVNVGKNKDRSARIVGKLPDGGSYSSGTPLRGNRYSVMSPLYQPISKRKVGNTTVTVSLFKGVTYGQADVSLNAGNEPQINAPLRWVKAAGAENNYYAQGINQLVSILTKRYPKLKKGALVPIGLEARRAENAILTLNRGNMDEKIEVGVTMTSGSAKIVRTITPDASGTNPYKVKLKANALLGTFSGSFVHPVSGAKTKFSGAFRAMDGLALGEGRGSFRGSIDTRAPEPRPLVESGSVRIRVNSMANQ